MTISTIPVFYAYFVRLFDKETPERMLMLTAVEQSIIIEIVGLTVVPPRITTLKVATKVPMVYLGTVIYLHGRLLAADVHPDWVIPLGLDDESS